MRMDCGAWTWEDLVRQLKCGLRMVVLKKEDIARVIRHCGTGQTQNGMDQVEHFKLEVEPELCI